MSEVIAAKAGGTSNATAEAVEQSLVWAEGSDLFVPSAPGKLPGADPEVIDINSKVTKQLIAAHYAGDPERQGHAGDITERFAEIVHGLDGCPLGAPWIDRIPRRVLDAVAVSEDSASMLGERLQAEIYESLGFALLDPAEAPHDLGADTGSWRYWMESQWRPGLRHVLIGNLTKVNREPVTFGTGGSDISGGYGSDAIDADLHLNLTDGGAKSADPNYVDSSRLAPIGHMLYEEGRELGRNGTGLLHPAAMVPLMRAGIPTEIRSTFDRDAEFTLLDNDKERASRRAGKLIALSLMEDLMMLRLHEPGMAEAVGRLADLENELSERDIALVDSQGYGVDGQTYFVHAERGDEAREVLANAVNRHRGHIEPGRPVNFVTLVGYQLGSRLLDYTKHLVDNWDVDIKQWQSEGHDFTHGRHSLRISLPSKDEALDTLDRLHASLIESSGRAPVTWRDTGRGRS